MDLFYKYTYTYTVFIVNYYKLFPEFVEEQKISGRIPLHVFKQKMKIFYGFGGRNNTLDRWVTNFNEVGLIRVVKENDGWVVVVV